MYEENLSYISTPVPGILSCRSNVSKCPGYPLVSSFRRSYEADPIDPVDADCPININYVVSSDVCSQGVLKGKVFDLISDTTARIETPLSFISRLSASIDWQPGSVTLTVNKTLHNLGRVTIGNVHSVGWMLRDLTNLVLIDQGYVLIHGAAMEIGDRVVLMIGLSNTGKTSSVISAVNNHGAHYYGDDLIVVNRTSVFACPWTRANIDTSRRNSFLYNLDQNLRRLLPLYENYTPCRSKSIVDILGDASLAEARPITDIVVLQHSLDESVNEVSPIETARYIQSSNRVEFTYYNNPLIAACDYFRVVPSLSSMLDLENEVLVSLSSNASCHFFQGSYHFLRDQVLRQFLIKQN